MSEAVSEPAANPATDILQQIADGVCAQMGLPVSPRVVMELASPMRPLLPGETFDADEEFTRTISEALARGRKEMEDVRKSAEGSRP